ncbi:MAG: MmcQ/YjbR family DNA-binding protein [Clostridiales bacterium]|jgi:predicted DNA-binding protein (MmcQ/YjbR family)|nr:MmcQ/YjbR family DNA-binding protein [Eubacteriales bacterium]MDH7566800.1 MmcQ/YjbR family DNA-binding protein [Clostridiales bacterium]
MDIEKLTAYCLSKPCAFIVYPFGPEPAVIKVGSKMFALISMKNGKACISLKCDPFIAQSLRQQYQAITPGYHLNKEHWNTVIVDGSVPNDELIWMIDHSYELVYKSLSKAERKGLYNAE